MYVKLKKELYQHPGDFAVQSEIGEIICKIAKLSKGYYLYNKSGEQIAQITFEPGAATLALAHKKATAPTATKMVITAKDTFLFPKNVYAKDDMDYLNNLSGQNNDNFSIWGNVSKYGYDIYDGSKIAANVVSSTEDPSVYTLKISETANIIKMILIAVAAEALNYSPTAKLL